MYHAIRRGLKVDDSNCLSRLLQNFRQMYERNIPIASAASHVVEFRVIEDFPTGPRYEN